MLKLTILKNLVNNLMSQDFIFIDPKKIPPRRVVRSNAKKFSRKNNFLEPILSTEPEIEIDSAPTEEFDLFSTLPDNQTAILTANPLLQESNVDPLTQEIFKDADMASDYNQNDLVALLPAVKVATTSSISSLTSQSDLANRENILSELENIEDQDQALLRKISRFQPPYRRIKTALVLKPSANVIDVSASTDDYFSDMALARAQDDWYGINIANESYSTLDQKHKVFKKASPNQFKIWLVTLALFLPLALGLVFLNQPQIFRSVFTQITSKILTANSLTLINTSTSKSFPYLIFLKKYLSQDSNNAEKIALIDQFLENNANFNWLNLFKKKESNVAVLSQLELLNQLDGALKKDAPGIASQFSNYRAKLTFWQRLLLSPEPILMVVLDSEKARPMGGKPTHYVLLKFNQGQIDILNAGKFSSLDAASNLKIIPPAPLQITATGWMPSEAGWFINFNDSAETLLDFFNNTTQASAAGVMVVNSDFLKEAGFKESVLFDLNKNDWFADLSNSLARKSEDRWENLSDILQDGFNQHKVQFYFRDANLQNFVTNSQWSLEPKYGSNEDAVALGLLALQGGVNFELIEHKVDAFEDGSLKVRMNLTLRHNSAESLSSVSETNQGQIAKNYLKIYLPLGSQILKQEGFSGPEKKPEFDYAGQGFSLDARLDKAQDLFIDSQIKNLDIFKESGLLVAAGWLDLISTERKVISLEYLLPFRLDYKKGLADYNFKIWPPHQKEKTPFRFQLLPQKGVEIISLEPNGFITQNLGEYQGNLSGDLILQAKLKFNQ